MLYAAVPVLRGYARDMREISVEGLAFEHRHGRPALAVACGVDVGERNITARDRFDSSLSLLHFEYRRAEVERLMKNRGRSFSHFWEALNSLSLMAGPSPPPGASSAQISSNPPASRSCSAAKRPAERPRPGRRSGRMRVRAKRSVVVSSEAPKAAPRTSAAALPVGFAVAIRPASVRNRGLRGA